VPRIVCEEPSYISRQVVDARRFYLGSGGPAPAGLAVICGGWERVAADYVVHRATFPWLAIEFVMAGRGRLTLRGRSYELGRGSLFTYGPGVPHRIESDARNLLSKYYVNFRGRQAADLLAAAAMNPGSHCVRADATELASLFEMLVNDGMRHRPQTEMIASLQLQLLLLKSGRTTEADRTADRGARQTLQNCLNFIDRNFLEVSTAEEVASACRVTPVHLARLFKRFGHASPYGHLVRAKMIHAATLFDSGRLLVHEVAGRLGMDPFHFSRVFKRVHGVSPAAFIRRHGRAAGAPAEPARANA